jgi:uncharacterized membrane protein YdjX (TVP38/TMEM64 family)
VETKSVQLLKVCLKVALIVLAILVLRQASLTRDITEDAWLHLIRDSGIFATMAFIGISIIGMLLFIPIPIFIGLGAAIFGRVAGACYISISFIFGACLSFLLGRYTLGDTIRLLPEHQLKRLNAWVNHNGFSLILALRLAFFGNATLNYALGMTKATFKDYFGATLVGSIPRIFLISYICEKLIHAHSLRDLPASYLVVTLLLRLGGIAWLLLLGVEYKNFFERRRSKHDQK